MQAYARSSTGSAPDRDTGRAPRPSASRPTTAARLAHLQATAGNAAVARAVQRDRHQHNAGCGHAEEETAVQRDAVADAVRSSWSPLEPRIQKRAEAGLGIDLGGVRVHTGDVAQRSAQRYGARAYTTGLDIVVGPQGVDDETMYHELTHVWQQSAGPVAGTDAGDGTKVSHPNDPFERQAAASGRELARGGAPDLTAPGTGGGGGAAGAAPVQRYHVINPGDAGYPVKQPPGDWDFARQAKNDQGSWYDQHDPPTPHYVYEGSVPLRVSDDFTLAVPYAEPKAEPKTFFATDKQIDSANKKLPGRSRGRGISLTKTGRSLRFDGGGRRVQLFEVQPKARLQKNGEKTKGQEVRLPQRCNDMASFVTGQSSLENKGTQKYWVTLGKALDVLVPGEGHGSAMENALENDDVATFRRLSSLLPRLFQELLEKDPQAMENALRHVQVNQHAPIPKVGDAMIAMAQGDDEQENARRQANTAARAEGADDPHYVYHFGGVVASSGDDYVTMENYAREQPQGASTHSGNDPLWYFRMYGKAPDQSWHRTWATEGATGLVGAKLSITLHG
ncbi:DUF4157 domain-containing protein [Streptomyces sp. NPDC006655]|uniref:eCIS core domain-containing protein n=1 Tax=Streptomyces sp. NPDC006655 TaxID=3156898 RepID=UPI0034513628